MLTQKPWARIAAIVGAVLSSTAAPIGTALCVYALWFFIGDNWNSVYPEQSNSDIEGAGGLALNEMDQSQTAQERFSNGTREPRPVDWR